MKNVLNKLFYLAAIMLLWTSCQKAGEKLILKGGVFSSGALTASTHNLILSANKDDSVVITFNWPAVNYGKNPVVTYTVQIDRPSDTGGANPWGNAKNFVVGKELTYSFMGKDLNNLLNTMGFIPGSADSMVVRVKSDVNQYNGSASAIPSTYSNTFILMVAPYGLNLYVPGAYQGWNPATAPAIAPVAGKAGLYEGYVNIQGSGIQYFKYTNAPDWNHTNYGDGGNGTFSTDGNAAGLSVPESGYYELTANLNNNTWTATKTTWGIIGDATPGGWGADTPMTYDAVKQVWTVSANMKAAGSFKFRANNAWAIDFGIDDDGKLVYADNPFFGYTAGLNNLTVPSDGNYTITLDLHVAGKYTYTLQKN